MSEVNFQKLEEAVEMFLQAFGQPVSSNPQLKETPHLVAQAWADEFLDGYAKDAASPFSQVSPLYPESDAQLSAIALRDLHFVGVCPHHLLPYEGIASVAYVPTHFAAGFGAFSQSLDALAHRLTLQEDLAQAFGATIFRSPLKPLAVLIRLQAKQGCLRLRGEKQHSAQCLCESFFAAPHAPDTCRILLSEALVR